MVDSRDFCDRIRFVVQEVPIELLLRSYKETSDSYGYAMGIFDDSLVVLRTNQEVRSLVPWTLSDKG